jgi:CheY-like chemotaxis protein
MGKKLVLIVDDEEDVARYLSAALDDEGFETVTATDAASGLAIAKERRPDVICLDLVMPARTGLSLYREILELEELADARIVVVSGLVPADAAKDLGLGDTLPEPAAFIEKPVDIPAFKKAIRELVAA